MFNLYTILSLISAGESIFVCLQFSTLFSMHSCERRKKICSAEMRVASSSLGKLELEEVHARSTLSFPLIIQTVRIGTSAAIGFRNRIYNMTIRRQHKKGELDRKRNRMGQGNQNWTRKGTGLDRERNRSEQGKEQNWTGKGT